MVYAGTKDQQKFTLGVSGRLMDDNLVMWDEETGTLWSQILGKGLHGAAKDIELDLVPAVFVGLGTWKRMNPETRVLDMSTVRAKGWFYTTEDLARGKVTAQGQLLTLGVGLRHGDDTLVVSLPLMQKNKVVQVEVDDIPLAVVWHDDEQAALVYDRRLVDGTVELELRDDELRERGGDRRWDPVTAASIEGEGPALQRFPYLPTYWKAWKTYYPDGRTLQ